MKTKFLFHSIILVLLVILPVSAQESAKETIAAYLDNYYQNDNNKKLYIQTDKYLYENGEQIWFSCLLVDRRTHQPLKGNHEVIIQVVDIDNNELLTKLGVAKDGVYSSYLLIPENFPKGLVKLQGLTGDTGKLLFEKQLDIRPIAFPFYLVDVTVPNRYYVGGERLEVEFSAQNYHLAPLKGASYSLVLMNGSYEIGNDKGNLNKEGKGTYAVSLPNPLNDDGLSLKINFRFKSQVEVAKINLPSIRDNIEVEFFPESGNLVHSIPNKLYYKVTLPNGEPMQFKGVFLNEFNELIGEVTSNQHGEGYIEYTPRTDEQVHLEIREPYAVNWKYKVPEPTNTGLTLKLLERTSDSVTYQILKTPAIALDYHLAVIHQGKLLESYPVTVSTKKTISIPTASLGKGINHLTLFNARVVPVAEVLLFHNEKTRVDNQIDLTSDRYELRKHVQADFKFDPNALVSFYASDTYRLSGKLAKQNLASYLILDSEVKDNLVVSSGTFNSTELIANNIESKLGILSSVNHWKDVFRANGKSIGFRSFDANKKSTAYLKEDYFKSEENGKLIFRNYGYENFYLGSNPILTDKLDEMFKERKKEPAYKKLLESGTQLVDVIYSIKPYRVINNQMVFPGGLTSLNHQGGALIVLDGRQVGTDMNVLNMMSPYDIETINVSTNVSDIQKYTGLNSVGVVELTSKGSKRPENSGPDTPDEFESPDYSEGSEDRRISEDLRTTIFWHGFKQMSSSPYQYNFYHSDIRCDVTLFIEGIDQDGNIISEEVSYHVL